MTTKEQLIELAKQAGYKHRTQWGKSEDFAYFDLERFAALVRDQYRAELLAGSGEPFHYLVHWPKIGGGLSWQATSRPLMQKEGFRNEAVYTADQLAAAVLKARNAALEDAAQKVANLYVDLNSDPDCRKRWPERSRTNQIYAEVIRNLKEPTPCPPNKDTITKYETQ